MKYLKTFEVKNPIYKVGDLVVAHTIWWIDEELKKFLYNNVGEIVNIFTEPGGQIKKTPTKKFITKYKNIPEELKHYFLTNNFISDRYTLFSKSFDKATPEEIQNQIEKDNSVKFNL